MIEKLLTNLFDFEREETAGEVLFYRLFDLVLERLKIVRYEPFRRWTRQMT